MLDKLKIRKEVWNFYQNDKVFKSYSAACDYSNTVPQKMAACAG
jgi:hypothetical protein